MLIPLLFTPYVLKNGRAPRAPLVSTRDVPTPRLINFAAPRSRRRCAGALDARSKSTPRCLPFYWWSLPLERGGAPARRAACGRATLMNVEITGAEQADQTGDDQVDRDDVIQEARHD